MDYKQNIGNSLKILLTGGHGATTGIAVIEELKKQYPNANISWIGASSAVSGSKVTTLEYKIYPSMGVKYFSINAGKLQTKFTLYTIPLLFLFPVGLIQAFFLLLRIEPDVILSFGGYSSFPVVFWGWVFGIPVILHEQTAVAGRSSILSAFFARKIALSRTESLRYFPKNKCIITGNPVMESITKVTQKLKPSSAFTILVMGGSRGSEFINEEIDKIRKKLTLKYKLAHITGERDYEKYKDYSSENYQVLPFVSPNEMADLYKKSDLIISRAGANTISELMIVKRPALLIPLPRTYMSEQYKNAKFAEKFGIAKIMLEDEVNPGSLMEAIGYMFENWQKIVKNVSDNASPDTNASRMVVELISEYI
jgi:UDP-N-acetylglucosamine--N-acetylmuramyl-(pentapeptide) pyrophosphoryl-undecaprenol N-acetylglucosamine transferase